MHRLLLTTEIRSLLRLYAQGANISITDVGNRIILGFLTKAYGFETPGELRKRILKAIFPNHRAIFSATADWDSFEEGSERVKEYLYEYEGRKSVYRVRDESSD